MEQRKRTFNRTTVECKFSWIVRISNSRELLLIELQ